MGAVSALFVFFIFGAARGLIWGFATKSVIANKGYSDSEQGGWFALGFFFGLIPFVVALTKPERSGSNGAGASDPRYGAGPRRSESEVRQILERGGWRCSCGRVNDAYVSTCVCGKSKSSRAQSAARPNSGSDDAAQLESYKRLLDAGILTKEEFEAKKKQILGL